MALNFAGRSRNARLSQARKHAEMLLGAIVSLQGTPHRDHVEEPKEWQEGREALNKLVQCFHEANACNNLVNSVQEARDEG